MNIKYFKLKLWCQWNNETKYKFRSIGLINENTLPRLLFADNYSDTRPFQPLSFPNFAKDNDTADATGIKCLSKLESYSFDG